MPIEQASLVDSTTEEGQKILAGGSRPLRVNKHTGDVQIVTSRGLHVNSLLRKQEWEELDAAVVRAARFPLRAVEDVRSRGLVQPLGGIGTTVSQWNVSSEMTRAAISMSGRSENDLDRVDFQLAGVPVPIAHKSFVIGSRELDASRRMGDGLDVTTAEEATRVVGESLENMLFNGASVTFNQNTIYGYRTHPNRITDTASNFGGGTWDDPTQDLDDVVPTVSGMISAANNNRHYGPFVLYLSTDQYNFAALNYFDDGSDTTPLDRIQRFPQIEAVQQIDAEMLPDGQAVLVQMSRSVVDWAEAMMIRLVEWTSGDGLTGNFKVMAVATPRVKARYDGKSGVVHATGLKTP